MSKEKRESGKMKNSIQIKNVFMLINIGN